MGCIKQATCYTCRVARIEENRIACGDLSHPKKNENETFTEKDIDIFNNKYVTWIRLFNIRANTKYNLEKGDLTNSATLNSAGRRIVKQIIKDIGSDEDVKKLCSSIENAEVIDESTLPVNLISNLVNTEAIKKSIMKDISIWYEDKEKKLSSLENYLNNFKKNIMLECSDILSNELANRLNNAMLQRVEQVLLSDKGKEIVEGRLNKIKTKDVLESMDENITEIVLDKVMERIEPFVNRTQEYLDNFEKDIKKNIAQIQVGNYGVANKVSSGKSEKYLQLEKTVKKLSERVTDLTKQVNATKKMNSELVSASEVDKFIDEKLESYRDEKLVQALINFKEYEVRKLTELQNKKSTSEKTKG